MGNQSASEMLNSLFAGVDIIIDKRLQSVSYDSTIVCTIVDDSNRKNGIYRATDGSTIYTVYSDLDSYRNGEQVRVQIPMGDYSQKKYILGKYVSDSDSTPLTYISPTDKILNVSDNLLGKSLSKQSFGLRANGNEELLHIFSKTIDSKYLNMQKNNIYTDIILKANFKTLLSTYDLIEGNFGLRLDLKIRPSVNSSITIHRIMELDSSEMFGNPYSFSIKSPQSKVFKINTLGLVETIALCLYQNNNFKKSNGDLLRRIEGSGQDNDIIVSDIVLGMGCDLGDVEDNTLQIYCEDDPQYNYLNPTEDTNLKNIGLLWLNKDENGNFIGFSDGIYDYDYDELEYLKKSQTDTRLVAQKGKENVPLDKTSLGLAANIEEAVPNIVSALKVVSTDMISRLRELKSYVDSVSTYTGNIDSLITTSGDKSLMNIVNDIYKYLGYTKENSEWKEGLIQQYAGVLKYGYETAFGMTHKEAWKDWWPILPDKNNYNIKIYNLFNKIETNINWLFDKTENFNKGEKGGFYGIDTTYSGYLSMYNTYLIRIQDLLAKMFGYLGFLEDDKAETYSNYKHYKKYFPKGIITDSTEDITDFKKLCNYKSKTKDKFKAYTSPDLSSYDNKYCIYWFRYEQDYEPSQEEQILDKGWRRLKRKGDFFQKVKTFDTSKQNSETYIKDKFYYINNANEDNTDLEDKYVLESADAPNNNRTYYKKFLKGDADGINVGLSSVWKNEDGENILNNEGKKLHAPRVSNGNGILQRYMAKNYQKEQYKAVLFYNHEMFESNILEFSNKDPVPDETTADQGDILIFKHLDNSSDSFQVYGITNYLMDASDEHRVRTIQVGYDGLYAKDNALVSGQLYWYVPNVSTMLTVDLEDLLDTSADGKGFTLDEGKSSFYYSEIKFENQTNNSISGEIIKNYEANKYYKKSGNNYILETNSNFTNKEQYYKRIYSEYCFYKQVIATKKEDADNYEYDWEKWDFTDSEREIDNRQFWYKIKPYYESNCQNNYIKCEFQKSNLEEIVHGTELFTFGVKGTSGTKYTLAISNRGSINAASGKTGAQLKAVLKDYDNNELPLIESFNGSDTTPITIEWVGYGTTAQENENIVTDPDLNYVVSNTELNFDTAAQCYGIIKVTGNIELTGTTIGSMVNETTEGRERSVDLQVLHTIPFSGHVATDKTTHYSDCLYISGPTQIIYNNLGTLDNTSIFNKKYELFAKKKCTIQGSEYEKDQKIQNVEWRIKYYKANSNKIFTSLNGDEQQFYNGYMPKLTNDTLVPASLYLAGLDCYAVVEGRIKRKDDASKYVYLWRQPIIILQNKYASALLNDWDGSFQINEDNGTILGTMFGAGRKNVNNQFEGVLMGDIDVGAGMKVGFNSTDYGTAVQAGIGIYGFSEGAQSFGLNIDGTAFFGKAGKGRIIFNGNSGTIASANWFDNGGKIGNNGVIDYGTAGMCIDLENGHIDAYNFKLTSAGIYLNSNPNNGDYYFNVHDSNNDNFVRFKKVNNSSTLLEIFSQNFKLDAWKNRGTATTPSGIYLNSSPSSGGYYLQIGNSTNFLKFSQSGVLDIKAQTFKLDAWKNRGTATTPSGIYLHSNPSSGGYYLQVGNNTNYLNFSQSGTLNIKAQTFELNAYESGVGGLFLDSNPDKNKSYFRVGTQGSNELCFKRNEAGTGTEFFITTTNLTLNAGTKGQDYYLGLFSDDQEGDTFTIGSSGAIDTWRIIAGKNFGVTKAGVLYASGANISGDITADTLTGNGVTALEGRFETLVAENFTTLDGKITIANGKISALEGDFKDLTADVATIKKAYITEAEVGTLLANHAVLGKITYNGIDGRMSFNTSLEVFGNLDAQVFRYIESDGRRTSLSDRFTVLQDQINELKGSTGGSSSSKGSFSSLAITSNINAGSIFTIYWGSTKYKVNAKNINGTIYLVCVE